MTSTVQITNTITIVKNDHEYFILRVKIFSADCILYCN